MINYKEKLSEITTLIFDFDGVLSDGKVLVLPDGEQLRMTNVRDGYALQLAIKKGLNIAIISGGRSISMQKRFESMNLTDIYLGIDNKMKTFHE
ncbi:MAG: 3-deoxy-D-manno-octulosonate 8-phosphate phosphatase, partial [Bacteroidales bacterium]|nr:3-deoxy-D-manno-octulosonate 8-phosphate phosphatase [Bacteroidales bacterium]